MDGFRPNGRNERVAVSYISIHIESDPPVFLPPPWGGIPLNRWSLIDRPAKKSGPSFIGLRAEDGRVYQKPGNALRALPGLLL